MYILAFDTTAAGCSIALFKDDRRLAGFSKSMDFGQAEVLIPEIKNVLDSQNMAFADLNMVVVCTGPGSFTGVRSGISAARAFGLACPELTVCGVNAFEVYFHSLRPEELAELNAVIIETKRDDFYYQIFDKNGQKITAPSAGTYDEIVNLLRYKKVSLIGDGVERFLMKPAGLSLHVIKLSDCLSVDDLALCGCKRFDEKNTDFPKPLYLRAPDVCLKP